MKYPNWYHDPIKTNTGLKFIKNGRIKMCVVGWIWFMFKVWYIWECLNQPYEILQIESTAKVLSKIEKVEILR